VTPPKNSFANDLPTRRFQRHGIFPNKYAVYVAAILLSAPALSAAQVSGPSAEAMVNCPELLKPEPLTPYGFAKATLVSLWYARNAAQRSTDVKKASRESTNAFRSRPP
jgi:hypothetical protein